jgi:hypothetical protein
LLSGLFAKFTFPGCVITHHISENAPVKRTLWSYFLDITVKRLSKGSEWSLEDLLGRSMGLIKENRRSISRFILTEGRWRRW